MIESVGFNDVTWLARGGLFHSDNMRVTEKFRREGNILVYDVTVEDPDVLLEPWVLNTRRIKWIRRSTSYGNTALSRLRFAESG